MSPLLKREAELAALDAALASARNGRGTVILLAGEAGIGKTALVRAFASAAGVPAHLANCEPLAVPAPLGPLHDIAETLGNPIVETPNAAAVARTLLAAVVGAGGERRRGGRLPLGRPVKKRSTRRSSPCLRRSGETTAPTGSTTSSGSRSPGAH